MSVHSTQELDSFIRSKKTHREYQKGDIICTQGEGLGDVYLVESGFVKVYDIDESGNERTISLFGAGSVFPVTWLLAGLPRPNFFYYEALTGVSCSLADAWESRAFVWHRPDVLRQLADHLVRSYINLSGRVLNLENSRVGERLEFVLLHLAVRLGEISGGIARLDASITQEEIARMAGVTRESLSVEINSRRHNRPYWRESGHTYIDMRLVGMETKPAILRDGGYRA